jgi:hypothetical protein
MQVINFPAPEAVIQEEVIAVLERALELAREGKATSAIVLLLHDDEEGDQCLDALISTDSAIQTLGMLAQAQRLF